jgi:sulfatase modifying factor 1
MRRWEIPCPFHMRIGGNQMIYMRYAKEVDGLRRVGLFFLVLLCWFQFSANIVQAMPDRPLGDESDGDRHVIYFPIFQHLRKVYFFPTVQYHNYRDYTVPATPYPSDQASEVSINTFFRWNDDLETLPDDVGNLQFEMYLAAGDSPSTQPIARVARNALDTATLMPDTLYTWQVVSIDSQGRHYPGPEWSFQTLAVADEPAQITDFDAMVYVPAGEFIMGCDPDNPFYEIKENCTGPTDFASQPLHVIYLDAFEIDKYEVTNFGYEECVEAGFCNQPRKAPPSKTERYGYEGYRYYPVLYVSWYDAQDYCSWKEKRLPTEAEWEKAARGTIDTRAWPWGHEYFTCDRANYDPGEKCPGETKQVGPVALHPNGMSPYGALDVSGNVAEWVNDKFDQTYYNWTPYANPQGSDVSRVFKSLDDSPVDEWGYPTYVLRGGDWWGRFQYQFVYYRYWGHWGQAPLFRNDRTGFRCARSLE